MRELILRDDDCFEITQSTRRFLELTKKIPVMLAVIPGKVKFNLVSLVKNPGSEIPGVPASEISAKVSPACNRLIYFFKTLCSLCI